MTKTPWQLECELGRRREPANLSCTTGVTQFDFPGVGLLKNEKTALAKKGTRVLNEHVRLSNRASSDHVLTTEVSLWKILNPGVKCLETLKAKGSNELVDGGNLLANGIEEQARGSGHDAKRNAREPSTSSNVTEALGGKLRDGRAGKGEQGVNHMTGDAILRVGDTGQIDSLVLLDDQRKVADEKLGRVFGAGNAIRAKFADDLVVELIHGYRSLR